MKRVQIGDRAIGEGEPTYVVAEAGRNHNGNIEMAKELIKAAARAGADAVKFQSFKAENLMVKDLFKLKHVEKTSHISESAYEATRKVELSDEAHYELAVVAREEGIEFLSTPEDKKLVDLLDKLGVPAFKTASIDLTYLGLLTYIAAKGKPMIVSTGMSTMAEISEAVDAVKSTGNDQIVLCHCVSCYPPPPEDINLRAIETLKRVFQLPVGYSDHTLGITILTAAAALGANLIEKHFTLDKSLPGPDHRISADPEELATMVKSIRTIGKALGSGEKKPAESEMEMRKARRKIVAKRDIGIGTALSEQMLAAKMCGDQGIDPRFLSIIVGRKTRADFRKDEPITWDKI